MCEADRATQFVNAQVEHFTQRHMAKLCKVYPPLSKEELIKTSGNKALIAALEDTLNMEETMASLAKAYADKCEKYERKFGSVLQELVDEAAIQRSLLLQEKQASFEFRIREAIGLVELVSSVDAFNVLNACRNEIEQMGKE